MHGMVLLATVLLTQQVPTVTLGEADARSAEGFTSIFDVHELADGRVLMTDNLDRAVRVIDLRRGTVRELGRRGKGPLEYESATSILRGRGDTILVTDNNQRRFVMLVDGAIVGTQAQPDLLRAQSQFSSPLADARGRLYYDVRDIEMTSAGFHERDALVIRWTRGASRLDTVAKLPVRHHAPRENVGYNPFRYRSAWALAPDGTIGVVNAEPYRVDWIGNGTRTTGEELAYERVRIDADERDAERDAFSSRGRRGSVQFTGRGEEQRGSRDPAIRASIPDDVFPPYKPPFTVSRVLLSPAGELWIPRVGPWDATANVIDVVGRDGKLVRRVRLAANRRVVGFGASAVYVAARDDVDLQWLERVPLAPR